MAPIREVGLEPAAAAANLSVGKISPAGNRAGLLAAAALSNFPASPVLRCAPAAARGDGGAVAVSEPETSPGRSRRTTERKPLMAITLGTFTQLDDGVLTGTFKTLNVTASLAIVPIEKTSDKAPDHRVYAGPRHEVGAGWSQVAKSSGETYINLKIGSPDFGPSWVRCRLVKLEKPAEDGTTHIALWEPRDQ